MILNLRILLVIFFVSLTALGSAQDFHYTQYFFTPMGVNPALAGAFNGSYRINGVYRDQYRGSASIAYTGFSLNADAPIIRGFRKQDWVGIGLRVEQATAGSVKQKLNIFGMGAAYHLSLDKKQTRIFTLGAQYATGGYAYDRSLLQGGDVFGAQINRGLTSEQASTWISSGGGGGGGGNTSLDGGSLNDLTVGVLYNQRNPKSKSDFKVGLSVEGILNPDRAVNDDKGIGLNVFTSYENTINKRTSLTSGAYYYSNQQNSAIIVNSIANYKLKPEDDLTLHGGLGVRNIRSALLFFGVTIKGIRAGLAYDLDIGSSTPATNSHKSIELGVSYIGTIYKKPKTKPIIYCPRL